MRFPATPSLKEVESDTSFGKTKVTSISLPTTIAFYSVTYLDFPTSITDKYDLNIRFDAMREAQAKRMSARVIEDSELFFGTYYGRLNVFETITETVSVRTFIVGPRLFMLFVGTKGKMSMLPKRVGSANKARVDSFFNSFEITKVPEAKSQVVKLPADFDVKATDTSFRCGFLGVTVTPPAGWKLADQETSELVFELGKDLIKDSNPALAAHLSDENTRILAFYTKTPLGETVSDAFLFVFAEGAPYPSFLPEAAAKTYEQLYLEPTEKVTKPVSLAIIAKRQFAWLETFDSETKMFQRIYFSNVKGMSFEVMFLFKHEADLNEMLRALETLRFSETAPN